MPWAGAARPRPRRSPLVRPTGRGQPMAQRLVSISRDRADRFSGASVHRTNVQVIADRRRTERRQHNVPASIERRRGDQRRVNIDNYLRQVGWVDVPAARTPRQASAVRAPQQLLEGSVPGALRLDAGRPRVLSRLLPLVEYRAPATSLARLLDRQGRREEARRVIPPRSMAGSPKDLTRPTYATRRSYLTSRPPASA